MGKRRKSGAQELIGLPWQFSAGLAVASFVGIRWLLPAYLPDTGPLSGMASTLAPLSWIALCTFGALALKVRDLPLEKQAALLAIAFDGDFQTPSCASCGVKMVARESRRGAFWGCTHYPRCRTTLQMRS